MCIFSARVNQVTDTEIFVRVNAAGEQYTVYQNKFDTDTENAMIIPIPEATVGEMGVEFINLEKYADFFKDIRESFPKSLSKGLRRSETFGLCLHDAIEVHQVGSFEASYVPSQDDFERLDERFRLDSSAWEKLPEYQDYGFIVFKFKPGNQKPHPMAFKFKSAIPDYAYFPTVHVHDGKVHEREGFDHTLYLQHEGNKSPPDNWNSNTEKGAKAHLKKYRSLEILADFSNLIYKRRIVGTYANTDIVLQIK